LKNYLRKLKPVNISLKRKNKIENNILEIEKVEKEKKILTFYKVQKQHLHPTK